MLVKLTLCQVLYVPHGRAQTTDTTPEGNWLELDESFYFVLLLPT